MVNTIDTANPSTRVNNNTQEFETQNTPASTGNTGIMSNTEVAQETPQVSGQAATSTGAVQAQDQASIQQSSNKQEAQTPQGVERTRTGRVYTPAVDIYETNEAVVLIADMPGVDDHSVDVTLDKNVLTIYGHVQPQVQMPEGYRLLYAEYGVGDYQRSFSISNEIDWEHIEGTVHNGVLRLTLTKVGPAQTRKIAIRSA